MALIESFEDLGDQIRSLDFAVRLVAVDGCGGAGKSTFAGRLARALDDAPIVATDHFASWDNPIDWWPRLLGEVIEPLRRGQSARYRWYDWERRQLGGWREVSPVAVVIIEGVSASRTEWADHLAFAAWVETPRGVRLERGLERDGIDAAETWDAWMQAEDAYVARDTPRQHAHLVVDGAPTIPHDPEREYVRITEAHA